MIIISRLITQLFLTILFALILYFLLKLSISQIDIKKVYFPHGNRFEPEQKRSNLYRLNISRTYLNENQLRQPSTPVDLAISVISAYRNKRFYLTQTLGYLIHELKNSTNVSLLVCYVEEKPDKEVEDLQKMGIDFIFLYQNRSFPQLPFGKSNKRMAKESNDYFTCLNQTNELIRPKFVLLLEDDALALPELRVQLNSLIYGLRKEIDYVKLFHPWYLRKIPSYIQACLVCLLLSFSVQFAVSSFRFGCIFYLNSLLLGYALFFILISRNQQVGIWIKLI
jgi:hypothetical protein